MFLGFCFGRIEWKSDGVSEINSSGPLTLLLVVAALIVVGITSGVLPQPFVRRKKRNTSDDSFTSKTAGDTGDFYQPRSKRETRRHLRRDGTPKEVLIKPLVDGVDQMAGLVLNRSRGGLQISAPISAAVGEYFRVRSVDAPDDVDWIVIQIRHCRAADDRWVWGCKFMRELPWGEILMFG